MGKWGFFITIEGIEGSGKTTLAKGLFEELKSKGFPVILTWEPGGTAIGEKIRETLLHSEEISPWTELFLFVAARKEHVEKKILPALREGKIVISDRFDDSTVAYQGYGRSLNIRLIKRFNKIATSGLKPNITFLIDIDPETSLNRLKGRDRIERESIEFHKRVRKGYLDIAKRAKKRVIILNGNEKEEEMIKKAFLKVIERLKDKGKFISLIKTL